MRVSVTKNGLTLRVIAGTNNAILGIDLQENKRAGCLGFSIHRTDLGPSSKPFTAAEQESRWLPNMLGFPGGKACSKKNPITTGPITTEQSPLQKFRWGDYTLKPANSYRFQVIPRYGKPDALTTGPGLKDGVEVTVTTEDTASPETAVFFNRAAAASLAFNKEFPHVKSLDAASVTAEDKAARAWLSNGLEEAILAYLARATDSSFALHAAVYEFQKPELLKGLKDAVKRGVDVKVVYHHRKKPGGKDHTADKNDAAIDEAKLRDVVTPREAAPDSAIMHNKFVVLLKKEGHQLHPQAVWTGSTNWTDGGLYGQLNVGHAIYDPEVAATYEKYFQLLHADTAASDMKHEVSALTPVSLLLPGGHKVVPIFSPQESPTMLHLYANLCENAKCLMVSAPFALSPIILASLTKTGEGVLRYMLLDKMASLGKGEQVQVIEGEPSNSIAVATTLKSPLHDFQGKLLEGKQESFRHAGIHIHSKIIAVDPFGSDPIIVTGSANFSMNSTETNDSNTLIIRGHTAVADIYATEFMRMFEHYHFRASDEAAHPEKPLGLSADDSWSKKYYVHGSTEEKDRRMFAGTS